MALPTPPPEMSRADEAGAIAAATYFLDLYRYTETSQDTSAWTAISHPDCIFCASVLDDVSKRRAAGQLVVPATVTVKSRNVTNLNAWAYAIEFRLSTGPDEVRSTSTGDVVALGPRGTGSMRVTAVYRETNWIVREVQLEQDQ